MDDQEEHLTYSSLSPTTTTATTATSTTTDVAFASQPWPSSSLSSRSFSQGRPTASSSSSGAGGVGGVGGVGVGGGVGGVGVNANVEAVDVDVLLGALFKEMRFDFEEYFRYLADAVSAGLDPRRMSSGDEMVVPSHKHDKSHLAFWSAVSCRDSLIVNCDKTFQLLSRGDDILRAPPSPFQMFRITSNLGISKEKFPTLHIQSRTPQLALRCIGGIDLILYLLARLQNRGLASKLVLGCIVFLCVGADLVLSLCRQRQHSRGGHGRGHGHGYGEGHDATPMTTTTTTRSTPSGPSLEDPVRRIRDRAETWKLDELDWRRFGSDVSAVAAPGLAQTRAEASTPARVPGLAPDRAKWKEWRRPLAIFGLKNGGAEFTGDGRLSEAQVE